MSNDTSETKQIAQTILAQIKSGRVAGCKNGLHAMMCWAARKFIAMPQDDANGFLGGLQFSVSGAKLRGKVRVMLAGNDTYTVQFYTLKGNLREEFEDMYFDQLAEVIDRNVESGL